MEDLFDPGSLWSRRPLASAARRLGKLSLWARRPRASLVAVSGLPPAPTRQIPHRAFTDAARQRVERNRRYQPATRAASRLTSRPQKDTPRRDDGDRGTWQV